jgi:methylthioribose-1-phosphate isomerase
VGDTVIAPENVPVYNPAFDITPHRYLTGIITEEGICYPPFTTTLRQAKLAAEARIEQGRLTRGARKESQ